MDIVVLARMAVRRWYVLVVVVGLVIAYALTQYAVSSPVYSASAQLLVVPAGQAGAAASGSTDSSTLGGAGDGVPTSPSAAEAPQGSTSSPVGSTPSTAGTGSATSTGSAGPNSVATPTQSGTPAGASNPLQTVQTTILALLARMQAEPAFVSTQSGNATYSVVQTNRGSPLIQVTASGTDSATVLVALQAGIPAVSTSLATLQDAVGATSDSRFQAVSVQVDTGTSVDYPTRTKGLVVTLVVGLFAAVLLAIVADAVLARRRARPTNDRPRSR